MTARAWRRTCVPSPAIRARQPARLGRQPTPLSWNNDLRVGLPEPSLRVQQGFYFPRRHCTPATACLRRSNRRATAAPWVGRMRALRPETAAFRAALPSPGARDRIRFQNKARIQTAASERLATFENRWPLCHPRGVMALVGYARVSAEEQDLAPRLDACAPPAARRCSRSRPRGRAGRGRGSRRPWHGCAGATRWWWRASAAVPLPPARGRGGAAGPRLPLPLSRRPDRHRRAEWRAGAADAGRGGRVRAQPRPVAHQGGAAGGPGRAAAWAATPGCVRATRPPSPSSPAPAGLGPWPDCCRVSASGCPWCGGSGPARRGRTWPRR